MRIKTLFQLNVGIALAVMIMISVVLLIGFARVRASMKLHEVASDLAGDISLMQSRASEYLLRPAVRVAVQWRKLESDVAAELAAPPATLPEQTAAFDQIAGRIALASRLFGQLGTLLPPTGDFRRAASRDDPYQPRQEAVAVSLQLALQEALSDALTLHEASHDNFSRGQRQAGLLVVLLITACGIVIAGFAMILGRGVVLPIRKLSSDIETITAGNLRHRSGSTARNEIGDFSRAFDAMLDRLQTITVSRDTLAAEMLLRQQAEGNLRAFLEAIDESAYLMTADGDMLSVNRVMARRLGLGEASLEGRNVYDLVPPELAQSRRARVLEVIASGHPVSVETVLEDHVFENRIYPVFDGDDKVTRLAAIDFDITARKQTEELVRHYVEELRRSNEELERFAYIASHDLQEPLRMVTSFMQLLERRHGGMLAGEAREFIGFAVDGARRMQQLINDLLAYSRINSHGAAPVPVDAEAALSGARANLALAIEERGAEITSDPLPWVRADRSQLGQLFQNLIGNALKFRGPAPPRIHVGARRQGGAWVFAVSDNGIGIEPRHFERIFEVFQRLHSAEQYPGTGIGLALCKRIVDRHGGRIWVESAPGSGTTFFFTLAATDEEAAS